MPYALGYGAGKLAMRHGGKALTGLAAVLANRFGSRLRGRAKATQIRRSRRPLAPSAGMRPWVFSKLTMKRGEWKDFVYHFDGPLNTSSNIREYGVENVFKLNDCFDPAVGSEIGQPLYWDQYQSLYQKYRVHAATVEVTWTRTETGNIVACALKAGPSEDTVKLETNNTAYVAEMPLSRTVRMSPAGEHTYLVGPRRFSMAQLEGEKWITRSDDYTATMTASPVSSPKLRIAIANFGDTAVLAGFYSLHITYHTYLYEPKTPGQSVA